MLDSNNEVATVDVPIGFLCLRCSTGVSRCLVWLKTEEQIVTFLRSSPEARELGEKVVNDFYSGDRSLVPTNERVDASKAERDLFLSNFDGFTREEFAHEFSVQPEEMGIQGDDTCVDPLTGERIEELFFVPGRPRYQLQCIREHAARHVANECPEPAVYPLQYAHAYAHGSSQLPLRTEARKVELPF